MYRFLKLPSQIPAGANYHLFKKGIKPAWEDPHNKKGGKWTFSQNKTKRDMDLNEIWLNTVHYV
jgi:translation initiation factor 4E